MPKKSAPKNKVVKSSIRSKKVARTVASPQKLSLTQSFLVKEQEAFHKSHPNANRLIAVFILLFGLWAVSYYLAM